MKYLVGVLLIALVAVGVSFELQRRSANALADEKEQAALAALATKRKAEEADTKRVEEILKLRAETQRVKAEVTRLRGQAAVAARETTSVQQAGEKLVASGTTDEIIAALTARGYHPVRCRP